EGEPRPGCALGLEAFVDGDELAGGGDVHGFDLVEQVLDHFDVGDVARFHGDIERHVFAAGAEGADVGGGVPGAAVDRLDHAVGHGTVGAVRRHQGQHHVDAAVEAPEALAGEEGQRPVERAQRAEHRVHHHLEPGDVLALDGVDGG